MQNDFVANFSNIAPCKVIAINHLNFFGINYLLSFLITHPLVIAYITIAIDVSFSRS